MAHWKDLNIIEPNGVKTSVPSYDTPTSGNNISYKANGKTVYCKIGPSSDKNATKVVADANRNRILLKTIYPLSSVEFKNPGNFSWKVPDGVSKIKVIVVAAGGGGACTQNGYSAAIGTAGGSSSIGSVSCTGGGGGKANPHSHNSVNGTVGAAGSPGGSPGVLGADNDTVAGGAGYKYNSVVYGAGGDASGAPNSGGRWDTEASGGSGGRIIGQVMSVRSGDTLNIVVGKGGTGVCYNVRSDAYARNGGNGLVVIQYGGSIEG